MRKILTTYLPVSLLLAFLAMVLLTCGGDGGGGGSSSTGDTPLAPGVTLTGLSINGPSTMSEYDVENYSATASWSDGSSSTITPTWSVNSQMAEISPDGFLHCLVELSSDQTVIITATYTSGGVTETDSMNVTVTDVATIPFTDEELSGKVFFRGYGEGSSFLFKLNAHFSLEVYATPGPSHYATGTWSNDPDGLFLDWEMLFFGPYTVERISDSSTEMEVAIHEMVWGNPHVFFATWEKTVPVDTAKLPGTYAGSDGNTWVFNADGTGSIPDFEGGGLTFTWSVDSEGVLRMPFNTGYTGSLYARATSQSTATEYTILRMAFTEHNTSTGAFYSYYGGIELTRQGGAPPVAATLTGLSVSGPSTMSEYDVKNYSATASWSDGSSSTVTPTWSVNPQVAEISPGGVLSCQAIDSDQTVTVTATYSSGGITEMATMNVIITNITTTLSVVITGTVPGTVAIAYDLATGKEAARDVADGTPKTFALNVAPGTYYLMFIENEGTSTQGSYPFYNITGGNVFTFKANTTLDLGDIVFYNYPRTAKPQIDPISGNANVTETFMPEASFSPGAGEWTVTRKFVNSTCSGHSPGTTVTEDVTIAHGYGLVTYTPAGTTETVIGFANVNTAILTASNGALETIYLTMQSDGSLAGTYSKVGYGGGCSEDATIIAVLK